MSHRDIFVQFKFYFEKFHKKISEKFHDCQHSTYLFCDSKHTIKTNVKNTATSQSITKIILN